MKSSFVVIFPKGDKECVISGVTAIYPNLNGFLFSTEDGEGYQIESHELISKGISGITCEYQSNRVTDEFAELTEHYEFHDHRKKRTSKK